MAKPRGRREQQSALKERARERESDSGTSAQVPLTPEKVSSQEFLTVFFGLVDSNEIEYFKQAESTLNADVFESDEDRQGFISSILAEARGKELKLVTNQICLKLMERLVLAASDNQLKKIFHQLSGQFAALCHHKYSSHVLETLLIRSAALIEKELANNYEAQNEIEEGEEEDPITSTTMESMFCGALSLLAPYWQTMLQHQYASHVMRMIILVVSGKELPASTMANSVLRSKKSKVARKMIEIKESAEFNRAFEVPPLFRDELRVIVQAVAKNLTTTSARELAISKIASPVMQLVLRVEGMVDRDRALWHLIFKGEKDEKDSREESFVEYLLSDAVGLHFLEALIRQDGARMKYIERLYFLYMKDRILKLARRSTTGVYIVQALLLKLRPGQVEFILDQLVPELAALISISENQNVDLARSVIDASIGRGNYRRDELIEQLFLKFAPNYDPELPESTSTELFENVLQLTGSTLGNTRGDWPTAEERRRALFLQKLLEYDYSFVVCVWLNCLALPLQRFVAMGTHGVFSHVLEKALVVQPEEPQHVLILRKKFLNHFAGHIPTLACNSYGSHIVDRLWNFTVLLPMYKDRIGSEMMSNSKLIKESTYGRLVWKNWGMELFARKKLDWKATVRAQEAEFKGEGEESQTPQRALKPIELKMQQRAQQQGTEDLKRATLEDGPEPKRQRGRNRY